MVSRYWIFVKKYDTNNSSLLNNILFEAIYQVKEKQMCKML